MKYRIVVDSCGELPKEYKNDEHFKTAPLTIELDGYNIIDDDSFDQADFLKRTSESPNCPKSACPSPETYMELFDCGAKNIYVVTLSSQLSGSYNSAVLAKNLYLEEHTDVNIHIFDSRSASIGETLIALKVRECEEKGMSFEDTVKVGEDYRDEINTFFVLETLETLRKNGRLSNLKAFVASKLNIKPVMGSTDEGTICQLGQARGINKAIVKLVDEVANKTADCENKTVAISHCNCYERAKIVEKLIQEKCNFKKVIILDTHGISSMYASDGGIIVVA